MKVASTLDGRIAPPEKGPYWITGEPARAEVHRMRHAADALLVGVGTVLADDPLLTDRSHRPRRRPLLRVVLDSALRTPLDAQLVKTAQNDVLIFFCHAGQEAQQALAARGVALQQVDQITLSKVLLHLGERQITSLLLEGGATIHTNALNDGLVDQLKLFYAPRFLGQSALPMLGAIKELPPLTHYSLERFGQDFALDAYLHDPWQVI